VPRRDVSLSEGWEEGREVGGGGGRRMQRLWRAMPGWWWWLEVDSDRRCTSGAGLCFEFCRCERCEGSRRNGWLR